MATEEGPLGALADAILDGRPVDWTAAASNAVGEDRSLLDPLKLLAALADVHRGEPRALDEHEDGDLLGERVGVYRLIKVLGRGGMGEVYLGERADGRFDQTVAVKLVKRGMDSVEILRRFERERRILARLEHPGIARILDAGETHDGRPYFVMELVDGEKITDYCRARRPLDDRLRLFASCCDAVDAAHRGLVVHRDLKPSNILVTPDGQVKLLDFGIAKLLAEEEDDIQLTRHGRRVITPAYAAPEQILGGGVTMATDVFALGVVLYELLTGAVPFDRRATTPHELASRVERETAERPSSAARRTAALDDTDHKGQAAVRRLRGDLDTITMKALAREPNRRYRSAAALADDIRRYLTSRPVEARPDSRAYRFRKFARRHRLGIAASGAVAATVVIALAVSLYQTAAARREAERAAAARGFLTSLFEQIDPARYVGSTPTVRELLERGSERVDTELAHQPELRADMDALLGQMFDQLGQPRQGEVHWRRALATRQSLFGTADARTAKAKKGLAISLARQARYAEAEPLFQQLIDDEQVRRDRREMGSVLANYALHKRMTGDFSAAEALYQRALPLLEGGGESASRSLATALTNLAYLYRDQGRAREAVPVLERALAIRTRHQGSQSSVVAAVKKALSHVHRDLGELDIAERYAEEALAVREKIFHAEEALAVREKIFPPNHPSIGETLESLAQIVHRRGDRPKARELYQRAIQTYELANPPDTRGLAYSLRHFAGLLHEQGEQAAGVRVHERALALRRKALGDRHPDVAESWLDVARGRLALGDPRGALDAARTGVDTFRAAAPADSSQLAGGLVLLADACRANGRSSEVVRYLEEAHEIWRKKPPRNRQALIDLEATLVAARGRGLSKH